jgi:hypothetical protein
MRNRGIVTDNCSDFAVLKKSFNVPYWRFAPVGLPKDSWSGEELDTDSAPLRMMAYFCQLYFNDCTALVGS